MRNICFNYRGLDRSMEAVLVSHMVNAGQSLIFDHLSNWMEQSDQQDDMTVVVMKLENEKPAIA